MKKRILIPGTIVLIIIVLLGFFIGCTVNDDPSAPGGKGAIVGTWERTSYVLSPPPVPPFVPYSYFLKFVYIFTANNYTHSNYKQGGESGWYVYYASRGNYTITGDQITTTRKEKSSNGRSWTPVVPSSTTFTYSITDNELTLIYGDNPPHVYKKQ